MEKKLMAIVIILGLLFSPVIATAGSILTRTEIVRAPILVLAEPGDANADGRVDLADVIVLFEYLFSNDGTVTVNEMGADANRDGNINIADCIYLQNYLFSNGSISPTQPVVVVFTRGDVDNNGEVNYQDVSALLGYLFQGKPEPEIKAAADVNNDGKINISDASYLARWIYDFRRGIRRAPRENTLIPTGRTIPSIEALRDALRNRR